MSLLYDGLVVFLPDDIRAQVNTLAASRGCSPQELLDSEMAANRYRRNTELESKAQEGWHQGSIAENTTHIKKQTKDKERLKRLWQPCGERVLSGKNQSAPNRFWSISC